MRGDEEERILTTDEVVRTTDEVVRTTDDVAPQMIITEMEAAIALADKFGPIVDDDYVPGKTRLRDALSAHFDLSQLQAEELCDALERSRLIRFVQAQEGTGWHIHANPQIRE